MGADEDGTSLHRRGLGFLRRRRRVLLGLAAWSLLEAGQTFLTGYALARALDDGFLTRRPAVGLGWLAVGGLSVLAGAYGTARVYGGVAELAEPLRDGLVRRVVARGVREADRAAVSRLTHQVEIARDTFAGLVMVSRSFVFTAAGALVGLFLLDPLLLAVVVPPLIVGLAVFVATLRPTARCQEAFLAADEDIADELGLVAAGLRDVMAGGAEERVAAATAPLIDAGDRTARRLAWCGAARVLALSVGGQLPVVLLLVLTPWLTACGVTTGALVGALAYLTQSLLPALQNLVHGLGTSGSRLGVVMRRLAGEPPAGTRAQVAAGRPPALAEPARPREPAHRGTGVGVELRGVVFAHGAAAEPVVCGLDLLVPAGGRLAVVGPSGVGKSTPAGLIAGLLEPGRGQVRVCGAPAGSWEARRRRVLIPQEAYIFSGTLRDNLGYLREGPVPDDEIEAAAEAIGAAGLLARLGGPAAKLDPAALSSGERQLLALARAYLSPAPVALLDEATCHLDPAAEVRAEDAFAARPGGTLIVIAHRMGSARRADRVLVMDGPHTVHGDHDALLRRSARYRDLVGVWHDGSHPAGSLGDADRVHPVAGTGLTVDGGHVVPHRPVGQVQAARDLRHGGALGGE